MKREYPDLPTGFRALLEICKQKITIPTATSGDGSPMDAPHKRQRVDSSAPVSAEAKEEGQQQHNNEMAQEQHATVRLNATSGLSATAAAATASSAMSSSEERRKCPYLDTVNRHLLDTDMEKVCSVSLSNMHVYACLVCGRFFQVSANITFTHKLPPTFPFFYTCPTCTHRAHAPNRGAERPPLRTRTPCRPDISCS